MHVASGRASRYSVSESAWKQALELRGKPPQRERGASCLVSKVLRPTGEEQGYACGYATCILEGNGQALSPSPQTRRASAPTAVGMAGHATKMRIVRQPLLRVRCTENERADWLHKAHAEERSLSDYWRRSGAWATISTVLEKRLGDLQRQQDELQKRFLQG